MQNTDLKNVDNLEKDIVKQPNEFTCAVFKGSAMSYRLIIFALFKAISFQTKNRYCIFTQNEFANKLGIPLGKKTELLIEKATNDLIRSFVILKNSKAKTDNDITTSKILWFQKIEILKNGNITMTFNEEITKYFKLEVGYSALELLEIGSLQSFYAMRYYGFAKSKSGFCGKEGNKAGDWWFAYTENEIRQLFGIEDTKYKDRRDFVKFVIKQPCEEVCAKTSINIKLQYEKLSKGKYLWHFLCSQSAKQELKIKFSDNQAILSEKLKINAERSEIVAYKTKYPEQFEKALDFVKSKNKLPFNFQVNDDYDALKLLKDLGLKIK